MRWNWNYTTLPHYRLTLETNSIRIANESISIINVYIDLQFSFTDGCRNFKNTALTQRDENTLLLSYICIYCRHYFYMVRQGILCLLWDLYICIIS